MSMPPGNPIPLQVDDLQVHFGGVRAIDGVTLSVGEEEIVGLVGQNGAGKTTLLNCVTRSVRYSGGRIRVFGSSIDGLLPYQVARRGVSRTFQSVAVFGSLTALQVGLLGVDLKCEATALEHALHLPRALRSERRARQAVHESLDFVGFTAARDEPLGSLSYGQAKLADLARAVAAAPRLLLLDEPASGLSIEERQRIMDAIVRVHEDLGVPVVVIEHDLDLIGHLATRTIVMDTGRILAEGRLSDLLKTPEVSLSLLGEALKAS
jgi:branched-chain amino acid transport system ATP-binding protein